MSTIGKTKAAEMAYQKNTDVKSTDVAKRF